MENPHIPRHLSLVFRQFQWIHLSMPPILPDQLLQEKAEDYLEGVDKINNVAVACYPDVEGACHGDETSTRRQ